MWSVWKSVFFPPSEQLSNESFNSLKRPGDSSHQESYPPQRLMGGCGTYLLVKYEEKSKEPF